MVDIVAAVSYTHLDVYKRQVYAIMESVDTKYLSFAPDTGQLQKGGMDAAQVVKDFAKITTHVHLKDFSDGKYMGGYCPLGMGVVDIESILKTQMCIRDSRREASCQA